MSFLDDLFGGVASGVMAAVSGRSTTSAAGSAIETCCKHLGLSIHERTRDGGACLQFSDPLVRMRAVMVSIVEGGAYVSFMAMSTVNMPTNRIPAEVMGYMLERNSEPFVAWEIVTGDDGSALFMLNYRVPTPGLSPEVFRRLCQTMTAEALAFDSCMDKAGLLR
jgi:hypothetical protein